LRGGSSSHWKEGGRRKEIFASTQPETTLGGHHPGGPVQREAKNKIPNCAVVRGKEKKSKAGIGSPDVRGGGGGGGEKKLYGVREEKSLFGVERKKGDATNPQKFPKKKSQ